MTETKQLLNYQPIVMATNPNAIFIHYPIDDGRIPTNLTEFNDFIRQLSNLNEQGHKLYIHCRGGHGRSELVATYYLIHNEWNNEDAMI